MICNALRERKLFIELQSSRNAAHFIAFLEINLAHNNCMFLLRIATDIDKLQESWLEYKLALKFTSSKII